LELWLSGDVSLLEARCGKCLPIVINRVGRRRIYLTGQVMIAIQLGIIGILGCLTQSANISYGIGALMMLINLTFATTLGPVCYTIVAELPASEVRAQTVVLARAAYVISGLINDQLTPRMLSTGDWSTFSIPLSQTKLMYF